MKATVGRSVFKNGLLATQVDLTVSDKGRWSGRTTSSLGIYDG